MNVSFLAEVNDRSQEIEKSLVAFETFKKLDEFIVAELLVIFRRDLNDDLQILADIRGEHGAQTFDRVFDGKVSEILNKPVRLEHMGVNNRTLK